MEARCRATPKQFAALIGFMESNGDIARLQQGVQDRIKADRLWNEVTDLLNSMGEDVTKSIDRWKKVWADWKTKTKKKALTMRRMAQSGVKPKPGSRQILTVLEKRVLALMGLSSVAAQAANEKRGLDDPASEACHQSLHIDLYSKSSAADGIRLDIAIPTGHSIEGISTSGQSPPPPPIEVLLDQPPTSTSTPASVMMSSMSVTPTILSSQQHQRPRTPLAIPPRRRKLRVRRRRTQALFERASSKFLAIEQRRLKLEVDREKHLHETETVRLQLESKRIEMQERQMELFRQLSDNVHNLTVAILQLRQSSLPLAGNHHHHF